MIDIIIPAYNALGTIRQTLASIAYQTFAKKLNVYIVDDCSDCSYDDLIDFFSDFINLKLLRVDKNGGPALARQYGIDHSESEYIIFIDSDDVFSDSNSVKRLYDLISNANADVGMTSFFEELNDRFVYHDPLYVWLHGKIYRREFLNKYNIRFNETRANEDFGFNQLCFLCGANIAESTNISYVWKNNRASITRSEEFNKKNMRFFTYNFAWAIKCAIERNANLYRLKESLYNGLVGIYHNYLKYPDVFIKDNILEEICFLIEYYDDSVISDDVKSLLIKNQYDVSTSIDAYAYKVHNPSITFNEFIDILKSLYEKVDE